MTDNSEGRRLSDLLLLLPPIFNSDKLLLSECELMRWSRLNWGICAKRSLADRCVVGVDGAGAVVALTSRGTVCISMPVDRSAIDSDTNETETGKE